MALQRAAVIGYSTEDLGYSSCHRIKHSVHSLNVSTTTSTHVVSTGVSETTLSLISVSGMARLVERLSVLTVHSGHIEWRNFVARANLGSDHNNRKHQCVNFYLD